MGVRKCPNGREEGGNQGSNWGWMTEGCVPLGSSFFKKWDTSEISKNSLYRVSFPFYA